MAAEASRSKAKSDAFWADVYKTEAAIRASQEADHATARAQRELDQRMAQDGWKPFVDGLYQAEATYTCGSLPCHKFYIKAGQPCPGGVYVEAGVYRDGVAIGRTNDWTPAPQVSEEALVTLVDTSRQGQQIRVNSATCHRSMRRFGRAGEVQAGHRS